jgi:hypothetical protein
MAMPNALYCKNTWHLKRKNIDLLLNLFLTAALLHVLIQSNGSSSSLSVEESDGFENWK